SCFLLLYFSLIVSIHSGIVCFFDPSAPTMIYTLSLHDALPISLGGGGRGRARHPLGVGVRAGVAVQLRGLRPQRGHARALHRGRSEEHTSALQSRFEIVCRLLLEKQKHNKRERKSDSTDSTLLW